MSNEKKLAAQVKAVNSANKYARGLYMVMAEIFRPFVGQKILTTNGILLQKVKKILPELPYAVDLSVIQKINGHSLSFVVKTCAVVQDGGGVVVYHETPVYIGYIQKGVLSDLHPPELYRCDYTVSEIETIRRSYVYAKNRANELLNALYPFETT